MSLFRHAVNARDAIAIMRSIRRNVDRPISLTEILGSHRVMAFGENGGHQDPMPARLFSAQVGSLYDAGVGYFFVECQHHRVLDKINSGKRVSAGELDDATDLDNQVADLLFAAASVGMKIVGCDPLADKHEKFYDKLSASELLAVDRGYGPMSRKEEAIVAKRDREMAKVIRRTLARAEQDGESHTRGLLWAGGEHLLGEADRPGVVKRLETAGISSIGVTHCGGLEENDPALQAMLSRLQISNKQFMLRLAPSGGGLVAVHFPEHSVSDVELQTAWMASSASRRRADVFQPGIDARRPETFFLRGRFHAGRRQLDKAIADFKRGYELGDKSQALEVARHLLLASESTSAGKHGPSKDELTSEARRYLLEAVAADVDGASRIAAAYIANMDSRHRDDRVVAQLHRLADRHEGVGIGVEETSGEDARSDVSRRRNPVRPARRNRVLRLGTSGRGDDSRAEHRSIDAPSALGRRTVDGLDGQADNAGSDGPTRELHDASPAEPVDPAAGGPSLGDDRHVDGGHAGI